MVWGDGAAQRNYLTESMTRTHHDIETMTRRLELEKRRLQRIEKELSSARRTYQVRLSGSKTSRPPREDATKEGQSGECEPSTSTVAAGGTTASAVVGAPAKALLNRLDVQRKKLNSMNHDNIALREEVDGIRRRRQQLNVIFERLKVDIKERSAQLADFVEETAASKTVHGDANQRIDVMKRHREMERRQFKQEVLRLREQLKLQDWERKEIEVQLKRADTGVQTKKELIIPEEETTFSEGEMMRRIVKNAFLNCIQRRHIKQHQKDIEVFEQAFSTIKQSTGIEHIEEIVKIFVNLESRNFSLLTYVNVMNREIEALEGHRRERRQAEEQRQDAETRHEQTRHKALADSERQLQATNAAIAEGHEATSQLQEVIENLMPIVYEIAKRIEKEVDQVRNSGTAPNGEMAFKLPRELQEETLPEWLEVVETYMGHFRDLLPGTAGDKEGAFPCTAVASVKSLPMKRPGHTQTHTLVKKEELPSFGVGLDTDGNSKRPHTQLTAVQKAELLDEDSEEEDFDSRPMKLKDMRARAEQSLHRRKKRIFQGHRAGMLHMPTPTHSARSGRISQTSPQGSPDGQVTSPNSRVSSTPARPARGSAAETPIDNIDEMFEYASSEPGDKAGDAARGSAKGPPAVEDTGPLDVTLRAAPSSQPVTAQRLGSGSLLAQAGEQNAADMSEDEVEKVFLQHYKMTREELQVMADHMQIHVHNLCFLKQEFDQYDQDQSGYIDARELKNLLKKLGEDISEDALDVAFKQLDSDGSGEIEFFEFCEWFTSTDSQ